MHVGQKDVGNLCGTDPRLFKQGRGRLPRISGIDQVAFVSGGHHEEVHAAGVGARLRAQRGGLFGKGDLFKSGGAVAFAEAEHTVVAQRVVLHARGLCRSGNPGQQQNPGQKSCQYSHDEPSFC